MYVIGKRANLETANAIRYNISLNIPYTIKINKRFSDLGPDLKIKARCIEVQFLLK